MRRLLLEVCMAVSLLTLSLYGQINITSIQATSGSYNDFDAVKVLINGSVTYQFTGSLTASPQKLVSGSWQDLTAWDYHTGTGFHNLVFNNKQVWVFRAEDYAGNFNPTLVNPSGNGTYRFKLFVAIDLEPTETHYSNSFSVNDNTPPSAPTGITRSIVGSQNNPG